MHKSFDYLWESILAFFVIAIILNTCTDFSTEKERIAKINQCTEVAKAALAASQPIPSCVERK